MNQVTIGGYLARDPEVRFTQQGQAVTSFTVAVNKGKDKGAYFINCLSSSLPSSSSLPKLAEQAIFFLSGSANGR